MRNIRSSLLTWLIAFCALSAAWPDVARAACKAEMAMPAAGAAGDCCFDMAVAGSQNCCVICVQPLGLPDSIGAMVTIVPAKPVAALAGALLDLGLEPPVPPPRDRAPIWFS